MKTLKKMTVLAVLLIAVLSLNAQTAGKEKGKTDQTSMEEFFVGKWKLLVEGLPTGDAEMLLVIEKKDGKFEGTIGGMNGEDTSKLVKVEIKGKTLNVNFMGGGWDVPIYLDKEKDGSISGSMNDMFDITGTKIIEE